MRTLLILTLIFAFKTNTIMAQQGSTWVGKQYSVEGDWAIETQDDKEYFVLGDNFSTLQGPDLKVYLTKLKMSDIENRDPVNRDGIFIGELKSARGAQQYEIPSEVDLSEYNAIVIHCKAYSVVWGGVDLK